MIGAQLGNEHGGQTLTNAGPVSLPAVPSGTVTFLFTDIEGSTRLLEQLREQYATVLADQRDLLRAAFAEHHGHEIDTQGDAFFVAFPRALDAINCVAAAQRALAGHEWPQGASVRVRMGLHTGEPLVARTGYVGMDVHRAARIAAAGHGGQVLLSQTTRELVYQDLPGGLALRALGEHQLKDIRFPQTLYQLDIDGLPREFPPLKTLAAGDEPPAPGEPPFRGLLYFDEDDAGRFFGREAVTARLVERLQAERILAVIGASGSGKSSVVRAGLVPAMRRGGRGFTWRVALLTPTAHPLEALATALTRSQPSMAAAAQLLDDLGRDPRSLHLWSQRQLQRERRGAQPGPEPRLLVLVDQCEELFTLCHDEAERRAFVDNLLTAAQAEGGGLSLVLTLRADFYEHLAAHPALAEAVAGHQEYLRAMSADELRQAIEGPATAGGWEFSPGLVDLLLHDVGAVEGRQPEPGALPLLSHALLETWQRRRGHLMNLKAYSEAGGVRGAIARSAEGVFSGQLSPEQQAIARSIFLRLTELGEGTQDTRRRVRLEELVPAGASDPQQVEEVLERLAAARLITAGEGAVEVAHEALIREWPTLREWLSEDREGLRTHRHLTQATGQWQALARDPGELYRGSRLAQTLEWAAGHRGELNALEQEFLATSQAQAEQEQAEREAQRQRELEAARKLAETEQARASSEKRRAEDQAAAARRLRQRAIYLVAALVVAIAAALAASIFGRSASRNAALANQNLSQAQLANTQAAAQRSTALAEGERADAQRAAAVEAQATAEAERVRAEAEGHQATSRELAIAALLNLSLDPERSILLALQGLSVAHTPEAENALHSAVQTSRVVRSFSGPAWSVAYSPDGSRLALGGDGAVRVVSTDTGQELLGFPTPPGTVWVRFSPDGTRLATFGHDDNTARVWDALTGQEILSLAGHTGVIGYVVFSRDGKRLATASDDHTARVWDAATGQTLLVLSDDTDIVSGVAFSPDGKRLITGSWDLTVKVRDAASGRVLFSPKEAGFAAIYSPDGTRFVTSDLTGTTVKMLDAATGEQLFAVNLPTPAQVTFSADGTRLLTGTQSGLLQVWDAKTGEAILTVPTPDGIGDVDFSPDGKHVAAAARGGVPRVWDITPEGSREWLTLARHAGPVNRVAYSPDGKLLATASFDGTAKVFDATTGAELLTLAGHSDRVYGLAFSPDGMRLATSSSDKTVKVWDVATGQTLMSLSQSGHGAGVVGGLHPGILAVAFSADGKRLASAGADGTAVIWDLATGDPLQTLSNNGVGLINVAFSPDGTRLLTASDQDPAADFDGTAKMWDLRTGQALFSLVQPVRVWGLAFSPDGTRFATGAFDGVLRLWDTNTGQIVLERPGHGSTVTGIAYSADGLRIATSSGDGTAKVWEANTGQELLALNTGAGAATSVAFSPDATRLATSNRDGTVRVYLLRLEDLVALAKTRVTRGLTAEECQKYLHSETCPGP